MSDTDTEYVPEEDAENPGAVVKKLRERLQKAEEERVQYLDGWQRARADFANLKRDEESRRQISQERITAALAEELVPILDSLEMAQAHVQSKELEVIQKQFIDALKKMQIERYGAPGDMLDPKRYEALQEVEAPSPDKDQTVATVLRSGYALGDYVIRPAQVSIYIHKQ